MFTTTLITNRTSKAVTEEKISGRVTPEMLAALYLYGLSSAHESIEYYDECCMC